MAFLIPVGPTILSEDGWAVFSVLSPMLPVFNPPIGSDHSGLAACPMEQAVSVPQTCAVWILHCRPPSAVLDSMTMPCAIAALGYNGWQTPAAM